MKPITFKSTPIVKVSPNVAVKNERGETVKHIVLIELAGAPTITDNNGKSVKAALVLSCGHPKAQFETLCAKAGFSPKRAPFLLRNARLEGQYVFQPAGTEYEANEKSAAVIAGQAKVGDILLREKAGYAIEQGTMPEFALSERAQQQLLNADEYGAAMKAVEEAALAVNSFVPEEIVVEPEIVDKPISKKAKK